MHRPFTRTYDSGSACSPDKGCIERSLFNAAWPAVPTSDSTLTTRDRAGRRIRDFVLSLMLLTLGNVCAIAGSLSDEQRLHEIYARRHDAPLWSQSGQPTAQAQALVTTLQSAELLGLRPSDYGAVELGQELLDLRAAPEAPAGRWQHWDKQLSLAALAMLHDLHFGRIDPRSVGFDMPARRDDFDPGALLERLATNSTVDEVLAEAEPNYLHYRLLRDALPRYRELSAIPGLTRLPPLTAKAIHAGDRYAGIPALRRLLAALKILPEDQVARRDLILDADLSKGLKRFQYLHGLREDGTLGRDTFVELTVPLSQRVRQIDLTLERWRWLPRLVPPTLIVNIPAFRLFLIQSAVDRESDMLRMNVIVGREYPQRHTPVFAADMNAIMFRPYWDVPASITRQELLPQLRRDVRMLDKQNLELVTNDDRSQPVPATPQNLDALAAGQLRLRQRPGPDNALGLIKFLLPNPYDVYLHSTPAQRLFAEPRRAFSHGCVRVSDPVALAAAVLQGTPGEWTPEKIRASMDGDTTFRVPLARPVHVLIVYGTAIASEDGAVHFFRDIYGFDARLEQLLEVRSGSTARHPPSPALDR